MPYVYLAIAIVAEVIGTTFLRASDGFTNPLPSLATAVGYGFSFYFMAQAIRSLPTGIVYATWSGVGILLIAAIAWVFQGQKLDAPAIIGMALIVAGVVTMNAFSKAALGHAP